MKKVLSLALCTAMMVTALVGCGKDNPGSATSSGSGAGSNTEARVGDRNGDGKIICGYISKNVVDPFHAPINDYAKETFDKLVADGVIDDWTGVLDGETDANKQIDRADECITKKCDYVIILPAEATASDAAVVRMNDAGIGVIVVNSKTDSTDSLALAYCGPNDVDAGKMLAQWVIDNCPDGGVYAHCQGVIGNSAQIQRGEGIAALMEGNEAFTSAGDFPCEWQADKAANVAADMLNQYGDELVAIICDNDDMSSAAQIACNNAGRNDVVCVGVDGNPNPLQMVKDGQMGATVLQDGPGQVGAGIEIIKQALDGKTSDKEVMVPFVLVTKDNVDQYLK